MSSQALGWVFENGLTWSKPEWITGLIIADDHRSGAGCFLTPAAIAAMSPLSEAEVQTAIAGLIERGILVAVADEDAGSGYALTAILRED